MNSKLSLILQQFNDARNNASRSAQELQMVRLAASYVMGSTLGTVAVMDATGPMRVRFVYPAEKKPLIAHVMCTKYTRIIEFVNYLNLIPDWAEHGAIWCFYNNCDLLWYEDTLEDCGIRGDVELTVHPAFNK